MLRWGRSLAVALATAVAFAAATLGVGMVSRRFPSLKALTDGVIAASGIVPKAPACPAAAVDPTRSDDPRPLLPTRLVAAVGVPMSIYFDNLVLMHDPDSVRIEIDAGTLVGEVQRRRWVLTPKAGDVGRHGLKVTVRDWAGHTLATAEAALDVVQPRPIGFDKNLLLVGDSITHQNIYPNDLLSIFEEWSPGNVHFVGTHSPVSDLSIYRDAAPGMHHEGYGGWSWGLFVSHYKPGEEKFYKRTASPFVFVEDGVPKLDVPRYLRESLKVERVDAGVFLLGLNETFGANPDDPASLDAAISTSLSNAEVLVRAFRQADPKATLFVALPAPFTRSDATFRYKYASIKPEFGDAWRHRRIQHAYARALMDRFERLGIGRVVVVASHLGLDIVDGYWIDDAGHPNELGGRELAESIAPYVLEAFVVRE